MSRFRYFAVLAAPLAIAYVVTFAHTNRPSEPASFVSLGSGAMTAFSAYAIASIIMLERNIRRDGAAKLRAKGKDPDRFLLPFGVVVLFAPAGLACLLWAVGWLAAALVYAFCVFSFLCVCAWGWRYRRSIGSAV